jgi:hypothetical protein
MNRLPTTGSVALCVMEPEVVTYKKTTPIQLYATDNPQNPGLYLIDATTGFETAIAAVPFGFSSDLVLVNPD